jgi:hypothetical protein
LEEKRNVSSTIPKFLKYVFLLHFVTCIVFGAWFYLSPQTWVALTGWPPEYSAGRMMGALFIALAVASLLGYRAQSWERAEIAVMFCLTWTVLGTIGMIWSMLTLTLPVVGWLMTGIVALFLVLFAVAFFTRKK